MLQPIKMITLISIIRSWSRQEEVQPTSMMEM